MKRIILAIAAALGLALSSPAPARAACAIQSDGLGLGIPALQDAGTTWANCIRTDLNTLNDITLSTIAFSSTAYFLDGIGVGTNTLVAAGSETALLNLIAKANRQYAVHLSSPNATPMLWLKTDGTIYAKGNVGIGTTSPTAALGVVGAGAFWPSGNSQTGEGLGFRLALAGANSKNSTTNNNLFVLTSSDTSNPHILALILDGGAAVANRYAGIQSVENGTANYPALSLQYLGGNVGIGTNAPGSGIELQVQGAAGAQTDLRLTGTNSGDWTAIGFYQGSTNIADIYATNSGGTGSLVLRTNNASGTVQFQTAAAAEAARLDAAGDLGIGTTDPLAKIHVYGTGNPVLLVTTTTEAGRGGLFVDSSNRVSVGKTAGQFNFEVAAPGSADAVAAALRSGATSGNDAVLYFYNASALSGHVGSTGQNLVHTCQNVSCDQLFYSSNAVLAMAIDASNGHVEYAGSAPTLSSCGTGPSFVSANASDVAGAFSIGTTAGGACTLTFQTAWAEAPSCVVTGSDADVPVGITSISASAMVLNDGAGDFSADTVYYHCFGQR